MAHSVLRKGAENLTGQQRRQLEDLAKWNQPLYHSYLLKEQLRVAVRVGGEEGCRMLDEWLETTLHSGLAHMVTVAERIADHYAAATDALRLRISNARTEACNTRIQLINRRAYGFHTAQPLIALALLDMGGLCPPLPGRG